MLEYIARIRLHLKTVAWARALTLLILLILVNLLLFNIIYSFYLYVSISALLTLSSVWLLREIVLDYGRESHTLTRRIELSLFGRRMLVLDSILEMQNTRSHQDILLENISLMEQQYSFQTWKKEIQTGFKKDRWIYSLLLMAFLALSLIQITPVKHQILELHRFMTAHYTIPMPEFYRESEEWILDLSPLKIDDLELQLGSDILESTNNVFIIGAKWTSLPSLDVQIIATKKGLSRVIYHAQIEQLRSYLPRNISIRVSYPFGSEEYSGLQDLEVWPGARISMEGEMNYSVHAVQLIGTTAVSGFEDSLFSLAFPVYRSLDLQLSVLGIHDLQYLSPSFKVQVLANQAPRIDLLFPAGDVMLGHYQWRVQALVETEDDQGVKKLLYQVIVTNRDPYLNFTQQKKFSKSYEHLRFIRDELEFKYSDIDMLPGDVATITIRAEDSLSKLSLPVSFNIISPDIMQLQQERQQLQQKLEQSSGRIQEQVTKLKKDVENNNLSGAEQKAKDIEQAAEDMQDDVQRLQDVQVKQEDQVREVQDSLKRMEEITRKLKQYSETLKDMQQWMQTTPPQISEFEQNTKSMEELLQEFEAMLDNLEYYKKYTDMAQQFDLLKQNYEQLKAQTDKESFERNLKSYQKSLQDFQKAAFPDMKDNIQALQKESSRIQLNKEESYAKSDEMMKQLQQQVRDKMSKAGQERNEQRKQDLERILHELFLDQIVIRQTSALHPGSAGNYDREVLARIVENVNALISSLNDSDQRLESVLAGLIFSDPQALKSIEDIVERNQEILNILSTSLRDNRMNEVSLGLSQSANHISLLYFKVLQVSQALEDSMKASQQVQKPSPQMSLSMDQLMQMQSQMSSSLQELMKQMQQQGGMSSQMKEMMDQLSQLQSQIRDNLAQAMQEGQDGLLSEGQEAFGMMDDIIKDLESYKVEKSTLEKSKQLEQKLLKAKKALQSKGISQKRKSESAGAYQVEIIADQEQESTSKIDLDSIQHKVLDEYYKKLIDKYRNQSQK